MISAKKFVKLICVKNLKIVLGKKIREIIMCLRFDVKKIIKKIILAKKFVKLSFDVKICKITKKL